MQSMLSFRFRLAKSLKRVLTWGKHVMDMICVGKGQIKYFHCLVAIKINAVIMSFGPIIFEQWISANLMYNEQTKSQFHLLCFIYFKMWSIFGNARIFL